MRVIRTSVITTISAALGILDTPPAHATSVGITTEAINSYPTRGSLTNRIANATGFRNAMTGVGSPFSVTHAYTDAAVWDTDFVDPQLKSSGNDTSNFDQSGVAIAFFSGHGVSDAGAPGQSCTHDSSCTSPSGLNGGNSYLPGTCRNIPGVGKNCLYNSYRQVVTESPSDIYGGFVSLNQIGGGVTFGESTNSGSWAGAGTNGGINLAVTDISFGITPQMYWYQYGTGFGGVHLWATLMPTWGDTDDVSDRGSKFAAYYQANANSNVASSWSSTLNSLGSEGLACSGTYGGFGGINGCGCNLIMSVDVNKASSDYHINNETWSGLTDDSHDATGNSYYTYEWNCNYDAVTYGWSN